MMGVHYNALSAETPTPAAFDVLFSDLGESLDLSEVEGFSLHICSENTDMEYSLDSVSAVPEPGSAMLVVLLAGTGLAGRRFFRRRRNWVVTA